MRPRPRWFAALLVLVALAGPAAAALPIPPAPDHRINDYAGVLSAADRDRKLLCDCYHDGTRSYHVDYHVRGRERRYPWTGHLCLDASL